MITEKDASNSTASNVNRSSADCEGCCHEGSVGIGLCGRDRHSFLFLRPGVASITCSQVLLNCTSCSSPPSFFLNHDRPNHIMEASSVVLIYRYCLFGMSSDPPPSAYLQISLRVKLLSSFPMRLSAVQLHGTCPSHRISILTVKQPHSTSALSAHLQSQLSCILTST